LLFFFVVEVKKVFNDEKTEDAVVVAMDDCKGVECFPRIFFVEGSMKQQ
jgi:hypothetical protein